jgi:hypothetical protein
MKHGSVLYRFHFSRNTEIVIRKRSIFWDPFFIQMDFKWNELQRYSQIDSLNAFLDILQYPGIHIRCKRDE